MNEETVQQYAMLEWRQGQGKYIDGFLASHDYISPDKRTVEHDGVHYRTFVKMDGGDYSTLQYMLQKEFIVAYLLTYDKHMLEVHGARIMPSAMKMASGYYNSLDGSGEL
jgi:hypothetical protein